MQAFADKSNEEKKQPVADDLSQQKKNGDAAKQPAMSAPPPGPPSNLQAMADNSSQVKQLKAVQAMAAHTRTPDVIATLKKKSGGPLSFQSPKAQTPSLQFKSATYPEGIRNFVQPHFWEPPTFVTPARSSKENTGSSGQTLQRMIIPGAIHGGEEDVDSEKEEFQKVLDSCNKDQLLRIIVYMENHADHNGFDVTFAYSKLWPLIGPDPRAHNAVVDYLNERIPHPLARMADGSADQRSGASAMAPGAPGGDPGPPPATKAVHGPGAPGGSQSGSPASSPHVVIDMSGMDAGGGHEPVAPPPHVAIDMPGMDEMPGQEAGPAEDALHLDENGGPHGGDGGGPPDGGGGGPDGGGGPPDGGGGLPGDGGGLPGGGGGPPGGGGGPPGGGGGPPGGGAAPAAAGPRGWDRVRRKGFGGTTIGDMANSLGVASTAASLATKDSNVTGGLGITGGTGVLLGGVSQVWNTQSRTDTVKGVTNIASGALGVASGAGAIGGATEYAVSVLGRISGGAWGIAEAINFVQKANSIYQARKAENPTPDQEKAKAPREYIHALNSLVKATAGFMIAGSAAEGLLIAASVLGGLGAASSVIIGLRKLYKIYKEGRDPEEDDAPV